MRLSKIIQLVMFIIVVLVVLCIYRASTYLKTNYYYKLNNRDIKNADVQDIITDIQLPNDDLQQDNFVGTKITRPRLNRKHFNRPQHFPPHSFDIIHRNRFNDFSENIFEQYKNYSRYHTVLLTDKKLYKLNDIIHVTGYIVDSYSYIPINGSEYITNTYDSLYSTLSIYGPSGTEIYSTSMMLNGYTYEATYKPIKEDFVSGLYRLKMNFNTIFPSCEQNITLYNYRRKMITIHMELDKASYSNNDMITVSMSFTSTTSINFVNTMVSLEGIINNDNIFINKDIIIDEFGKALATFRLPSTFITDAISTNQNQALLIAKYNYYNYIESTSLVIPVYIKKDMIIDIYPFGGYLTESTFNSIYIHAHSLDMSPLSIECIIEDQNKNEISTIQTNTEGYGHSTLFTILPNYHYYITIKQPEYIHRYIELKDIIHAPSMNINKSVYTIKDTINISIQFPNDNKLSETLSNHTLPCSDSYSLLIYKVDHCIYNKTIDYSNKLLTIPITINIEKELLPLYYGVLRVTLVIPAHIYIPIAETLIFIHPPTTLSASISLNKPVYSIRENITTTIQLESNIPTQNEHYYATVYVVNTETFEGNKSLPISLYDIIYLQGEVNLHDINIQDLINNSEESNNKLHFLLNIQGWRRFAYKNLLSWYNTHKEKGDINSIDLEQFIGLHFQTHSIRPVLYSRHMKFAMAKGMVANNAVVNEPEVMLMADAATFQAPRAVPMALEMDQEESARDSLILNKDNYVNYNTIQMDSKTLKNNIIRKDSPDLLFYQNNIELFINKPYIFKFPSADSLSKYRIHFDIFSTSGQYLSKDTQFTVTKPLSIHLKMNTELNDGDSIHLPVLLHSDTKLNTPIKGSLSLYTDKNIQVLPYNNIVYINTEVTRCTVPLQIHYQNRSNFDRFTTQKKSSHYSRFCYFCIPEFPSKQSISRGISDETDLYIQFASNNGSDFIKQTVTIHSIGFPYSMDIPLLIHNKYIDISDTVLPQSYRQLNKKNIINESLTDYLNKTHIDINLYNSQLITTNPHGYYTIPNDILSDTLTATLSVSTSLLSTLYETMSSLNNEPYGCFEQTSSTVYPMISLLSITSFLGITEDSSQIHTYIQHGLDKLYSYEIEGGGFDWFGNGPAHEALTAYGILEFTDISKVHTVKLDYIERAENLLLNRRLGNGEYNISKRGIDHIGSSNHLTQMAYITYALSTTTKRNIINKEIDYLYSLAQNNDTYIVALACLTSINMNNSDSFMKFSRILLSKQNSTGSIEGGQYTITNSYGISKDIETTALSLRCLNQIKNILKEHASGAKTNKNQDDLSSSISIYTQAVQKGLEWLIQQNHNGRFGSTQGTVLTLQLMYDLEKDQSISVDLTNCNLEIIIDDIKYIHYLNTYNNPVTNINLASIHPHSIQPGNHSYSIILHQTIYSLRNTNQNLESYKEYMNLPVYMHLKYMRNTPDTSLNAPLSLSLIKTVYAVKEGDYVPIDITIENHENRTLGMVVAIIGIPSGGSLELLQLEKGQKQGLYSFFEIRGTDLILYWETFSVKEVKSLRIYLNGDICGHYFGKPLSVYEYYNDNEKYWYKGIELTVSI